MKKILAFTMALLVTLSVAMLPVGAVDLAPVGGYAPNGMVDETCTTDEGYVYFIKEDGTATVCGVPEEETHVVIPAVVDGYTVTEVGAYRQRLSGGENTLSLTVSEGVLYLDGYVLCNFDNVETINLPSSLIEIAYQNYFDSTAYYQNPDNWDKGVMYIGTNLVTINNDVPETLVVREGTTCVAGTAVRYTNTVIKEVVFPKHPVYGIENLTIPTLERATVPAEMGVIPDYLFSGCEKLQDVTIEDGITAIGFAAFRGCSSLDEIVIPDSVTHIGEDAFATCGDLKQIHVPSSVSSIDEHALGYERYSYHDYFTGEWLMKYRKYNDFSISGAVGSAAHEYAQNNQIPFIASPDESTPDSATLDEECYGKVGDANIDGKVNVKDATAVQKHIADMSTLCDEGVQLADADGNSRLNVKDATAIQKYVAGMETGLAIGERTDVKIFVRVYGKKGVDWWDTDDPFCFYYYKDEFDDMIAYPGVEGEFDALAGGWGALIPVDAKYIRISFAEFDSIDLPLPEKDGMIAVPGERVGVYLYDCTWQ